MRFRRLVIAVVVASAVGFGSAWAQIAVTDPATTGRNAMIAVLKNQLVEVVRAQHERLRNMAERLSAHTDLRKYATPERPEWGTYGDTDDLGYGGAYRAALSHGDPHGDAYAQVARTRQDVGNLLATLDPDSRTVIERELATLDAADSALISATHEVGALRSNGRYESRAIDTLQSHVIDPSQEQSTTAVLDKISGAALIETRQKQARLQYLTALVEQLMVDNKRARDTEAAALNMRLRQLQRAWDDEGGSFVAGASEDLRTWRQP